MISVKNIRFVINNKCNTSCDYCWSNNINNEEIKEKDIPQIIKFINQYFNKQNIDFNFIGGEPLLSFDFIKKIIPQLKIHFQNSSFGITTNLMLLNDEIINFISDHKIIITVSMDGMKEAHSVHRKNWDLVFNNLLKLIKNYDKNNIKILTVITPEIINNFEDDFYEFKKLGIRVKFNIDFGSNWDDNLIDLAVNKLLSIQQKNNYIINSLFRKNIHYACITIDDTISIGPDSNLYFCHRKTSDDTPSYGDIYSGFINEKLLKVNNDYEKNLPESCKSCIAYLHCKGGCRILSEKDHKIECKFKKAIVNKWNELDKKEKKMGYFDLKVGFTCNNNCVHCVVSDKRGQRDLTTEELKEIIINVPKDQTIGFTGGEASIRKDFIELLKFAKETGHGTYLQTNGTRFSDWNFAVEASKYLDGVLIAIHSHIKSVHDSIVRVTNAYEQTVEGFKNIIKLNIPCRTQTVISKLNIENLLETYDFIQKIKPGIQMSLTYPHLNGSAYHNADIVASRFSDIKQYIQPILSKYAKLLNTEAIPMCYLYPYQDDVYNIDEHLIDTIRPGIDPANRNNQYFDENGYTPNYRESMLSEKRKAKKCLECIFKDRCVGVWKEYVELYRNNFDLFPIANKDTCNNCAEEIKEKIKENKFNQMWGAVIVYGQERCMNRCTFCNGSGQNKPEQEIFEKAIEDVSYHIRNGIKKIEISGGDPGQFSRIAEVVDFIRKNGCDEVQLSTHGRTLKNENLVKSLKLAGITAIKIPIYGSNDIIHNRSAQYGLVLGNAYEDTIEGIKNCVKYNIPIIGQTLLNQYNKEDILNVIQLYINLVPKELLRTIAIGIAFISQVDYSYTAEWFLPLKDMKPYIQYIFNNIEKLSRQVNINFLDIPYCVLGKYDKMFTNPLENFPNLGKHDVEKLNRSEQSSKIPHYRIKSHFAECKQCALENICGGISVNELKMFGFWGLEAIKDME